jgi:hypothetical protein
MAGRAYHLPTQPLARRSKKKKKDRRERPKTEKKKSVHKQEDRFLVTPDDL